MKTLVHTDKELIEATIKKCDICYVGLADTDGTPYVSVSYTHLRAHET